MKQHMKPNQFECNQQWQHRSKCVCHQQITQCQFIDKKFEGKVVKGHEFVHAIHEKQFIFHHEHNKKGKSPLDTKVDHKCIESKWKIKIEGGPTWCKTL
jgi:hypothetical protein